MIIKIFWASGKSKTNGMKLTAWFYMRKINIRLKKLSISSQKDWMNSWSINQSIKVFEGLAMFLWEEKSSKKEVWITGFEMENFSYPPNHLLKFSFFAYVTSLTQYIWHTGKK